MNNKRLLTPVVLMIFNRPDVTKRVFEAIARARPEKLFVIADGPRDNRPGDLEKCLASRAIIDNINWECEVLKSYSDTNMGSKRCISGGLDWVFSKVEEAIILEDDILPSLSFFYFCQELLEKYRNNKQIKYIGGYNYQRGRTRTAYSYFFARYTSFWGWATWKRTWQDYDVCMKDWPEFNKSNGIKQLFKNRYERKYWTHIFDITFADKIDTWDYQMFYACWVQGGLAVQPNLNFVSNIGFGHPDAANLRETRFRKEPLHEICKISHPPTIVRHKKADIFAFNDHFGGKEMTLCSKICRRLSAVKKKIASLI